MTNAININIERSGFPVKLGEIALWFDCSIENLRGYFDVEEIANEKLKKAQEEAKHIHFPENIDQNNLDVAKVDAAIDVNKEFIAAIYDIWFGDGTFKKIYEVYPDVIALEGAIDPLGEAIGERITQFEEERSLKVKSTKKQYTHKKEQKKK